MDAGGLEHTLRGYGVAVDKNTLQRALDDADHGTAFREWARLHLGPDNLLSKDELTLYSSLDKAGEVDKLASSHDLASVQALNEREIQTAIDELNRSTAAITKQTEALKQQQDALARLVRNKAKTEEARSDLAFKRAQKQNAERRKISSAVEELSQNLDFRAADLEQLSKVADSNLHQIVDSLFHSDDKLLSSLQKLGWELETEDPEDEERVAKLREICMRLIKFTVETIRTKLDRLYLESLQSVPHAARGKPASSDEIQDLQEELESLYAEILPVAQMSVEQQHLEPALKSLSDSNGLSLGRSAIAVAYINSCLDYVLDHIDRLSSQVELLQAHQSATATLITTTTTELSVALSPSAKKATAANTASPMRRRRSSGHGSPVRTRSNTAGSGSGLRRRSSGTILDEPPLEALLRSLALALPASEDDVTGSREHVSVLSTTLGERTEKAGDVARNAQETFENSATTQLGDARRAVQLLRDSVLAESPFGAVRLMDPEIEGSIAVLGQEIGKVKDKLDGIDVGKARSKSEKRTEILQRWTR